MCWLKHPKVKDNHQIFIGKSSVWVHEGWVEADGTSKKARMIFKTYTKPKFIVINGLQKIQADENMSFKGTLLWVSKVLSGIDGEIVEIYTLCLSVDSAYEYTC